jgi:hypothetical protein
MLFRRLGSGKHHAASKPIISVVVNSNITMYEGQLEIFVRARLADGVSFEQKWCWVVSPYNSRRLGSTCLRRVGLAGELERHRLPPSWRHLGL